MRCDKCKKHFYSFLSGWVKIIRETETVSYCPRCTVKKAKLRFPTKNRKVAWHIILYSFNAG